MRGRRNIIYLGLLLSCCISGTIRAQSLYPPKHEFSFYLGGGLSTFDYDFPAGERKNGAGFIAGLGYHYLITDRWSIGTGIEITLYRSVARLYQFAHTNVLMDNPYLVEENLFLTGYKETQRSYYFQVPVMISYHFGQNRNIWISAGGRVGIPISPTSSIKVEELRRWAYYEEENCEYTEHEFMGYGTWKNIKKKADIRLKTAFLLSVEAGIKYKLSDQLFIFPGIYVNYGLNSVINKYSLYMFPSYYRDSKQMEVNSIMHSSPKRGEDYSPNTPKSMVNKVNLLSFGIKLGVSFTPGKKYRCK